MRRTLDIEALPTALRVLAHEATRIALEAPPTEPAALADDADVTLGALSGADDAASRRGRERRDHRTHADPAGGAADELERTGRVARSIMIMAGGTGGHVFPALAVADELRARGWRVVWLGARAGMEATLVAAARLRDGVGRASPALRGKGLAAKLLLPLNLLVALLAGARAIFARCARTWCSAWAATSRFPGGMMAALLGRPLAIHEQNSIAGLANRVLAGVADRVLVAFPGRADERDVWTGNPVRAEIAALAPPARALRRAQRAAARPGGRRQPGARRR